MRQRNNILTVIIKETWQEKEKVLFYEKYNKKINIINYILLDLTSYKKFKLEMQYKYLNEIKGNNILKSTKKAFLNNFNNLTNNLYNLFSTLNRLIFLKTYFKMESINKYSDEIALLININFLKIQILLYFTWDYLLINSNNALTKQELFDSLIIDTNLKLNIIFSNKLGCLYDQINFNSIYPNYLNILFNKNDICLNLYEAYIFIFKFNEDIYFEHNFKNRLYKQYYY